MITVIIPTLNEERTVRGVVEYALRSPHVTEVIVVDDKSLDKTVSIAKEAGAKIITSTKLGKGTSMRDGLLVAQNDIVAFLDADIDQYDEQAIPSLTNPLLRNEADFVKATFERDAGRVTELVAKPLLTLLIPALRHFSQPLSGMIAARTSLLKQLTFENDYGVDIGLLIDAHLQHARIVEVSIGSIAHKSKTWSELSPMAREVARAILKRSSRLATTLGALETIQIVRDQMDLAIKESMSHLKKVAIFDMDNTLLRGRFIDCCAEKFGFTDQLEAIRSQEQNDIVRTKKIAQLLKGKTIAEMIAIIESIPLTEEVTETIGSLKKRGYLTGIITDSYDVVALHVQHAIGADFSIGNELEFSSSVATGEVKIPSFLMHTERSLCPHDFCKANAMLDIVQRQGTDLGNVIAVGDSFNDICMVKFAGIGISFCSQDQVLNSVANMIVRKPSFRAVLKVAR